MRNSKLKFFVAIAALGACALTGSAYAQKRPFADRPIQILVGFPAGGIFDTVNRILISRMSPELGVHMIPVPSPGAGGAIAMQKVARGTPDGHTLMLVPSATLLARPLMMGLPVDHRDFAPIATVAINFTMIAVKLDSRWKSVDDVIRDARANPGKYSYAIPAIGGNPHFAMELVSRAANIRVVPVPYQGSPQAIAAVLGNETELVVTDNTHPQIRSLATLNAKRSPFQPNVPTLRELGFDVELFSRFSLVAPKGIPGAAVKALEQAARTAVDDPEVRRLLERQQLEPVFESGAELAKIWEKQAVIYKQLIEDLGLAHHQQRKPAK
ncbi:MAG: tripartite tricarboxylate transporter substrate binding protein [Betaproteobacteria bacterium]|nr:tripartite tricarboxylate transporter substrate binding protein [Betaproteobacteria bacterium]